MRRIIPVLMAVLPGMALAQGTPPPSVLITTETPRQGALPRTLTAYGVVQAAPGSSETLSLLRAGQVTQVMAAVGQRVQQGQPLLVITADPAALATYRQAVAALALARGERARLAQMLAQQLATRDQLAVADKAVTDAQGNLDLLTRGAGAARRRRLRPRSMASFQPSSWRRAHASHRRRPWSPWTVPAGWLRPWGSSRGSGAWSPRASPPRSSRWTAAARSRAACCRSAPCWTR